MSDDDVDARVAAPAPAPAPKACTRPQLVHETYLRLARNAPPQARDPGRFIVEALRRQPPQGAAARPR